MKVEKMEKQKIINWNLKCLNEKILEVLQREQFYCLIDEQEGSISDRNKFLVT